jgi:hypothetical protein
MIQYVVIRSVNGLFEINDGVIDIIALFLKLSKSMKVYLIVIVVYLWRSIF